MAAAITSRKMRLGANNACPSAVGILMVLHVLLMALHEFEILVAVIASIPIPVMNRFRRLQVAAEASFHYDAVFEDVAVLFRVGMIGHSYGDVPRGQQKSPAFPRRVPLTPRKLYQVAVAAISGLHPPAHLRRNAEGSEFAASFAGRSKHVRARLYLAPGIL